MGNSTVKAFTIKNRFVLTTILLSIIIVGIGSGIFYFNKKAQTNKLVIQKLHQLEKVHQSLLLLQKDVITKEYLSDASNTEQVNKLNLQLKELKTSIELWFSDLSVSDWSLPLATQTKLSALEIGLIAYTKELENLFALTKTNHFQNVESFGNWNDIHQQIQALVENAGDKDAKIHLLTLLLNEKDYLLNKNPEYHKQVQHELFKFQNYLSEINNEAFENSLLALLNEYNLSFNNLVEIDEQIGYYINNGLLRRLTELHDENTHLLNSALIEYKKLSENIHRALLKNGFLALLLLSISCVFLAVFTLHEFALTSCALLKHTKLLSTGAIPDKTKKRFNNELSKVLNYVNIFTDHLHSSSHFAIEIGNGNLSEPYKVLGEQDVLGNSLIAMKNQLAILKTEENNRKEFDKNLHFYNKGISELIETIQINSDTIEALSQSVISFLTPYTESIQGGVFIFNDEPGNSGLEMTAHYGFDGEKLEKQKYQIGEGFVGTCFKDGEVILQNEIPENYICFSSSLGIGSPSTLLFAPLSYNNKTYGVIELAHLTSYSPNEVKFIQQAAQNIAAALASVQSNNRNQMLFEKQQEQAEALSVQEDEMRQNVEELMMAQEEYEHREQNLQKQISKLTERIKELESQNYFDVK